MMFCDLNNGEAFSSLYYTVCNILQATLFTANGYEALLGNC